MNIDDKKWDEFIKSYFIAVLGGIVSGYMVVEVGLHHLNFLLYPIYVALLAVVGAIVGYIIYSRIGIKSKPHNIAPNPPPPSSPV